MATDYKMLAYYSVGAIVLSIAGMYYTLSMVGDKEYPDEMSCKKAKDYADNLTVETAADGMGCIQLSQRSNGQINVRL